MTSSTIFLRKEITMQNLWAPWRMELIKQMPVPGCFFCEYPKEDQDEKNLILERHEFGFVIMNRFPYNNGHLLVAPYEHIGQLTELSHSVRSALMEYVNRWQKILQKTMRPDGFNIGMNQGKVAGAGVGDHLHWHIIPRWNGDTSFIAILSEVKVINQFLSESYKELKAMAAQE
jgi:ATP adenylyltransferase